MPSLTFVQRLVQQAMHTRSSEPEGAPSIDKRRWLSFLTWAFVLAEMAGRDALLPNSAHAAEADTGHNEHHPTDTAPIANNLPNIDVSTAAENPEPVTYQHAAPMPAYTSDAMPSELSAAKTIFAADPGPEMHMGGHGGGGGAFLSDASESAGAPVQGDASSILDGPIVAAIGHDGSLIDLGLHSDLGNTVQSLLGSVTGTLGNLPLLGDTLEDLGGTLAKTTGSLFSALEPAVSLVGIGSDDHGQFGSDLGLPGQLLFSSAGNGGGAGELGYPQGNYTSYGIALSIGASHDGSTLDAPSTHADADASTATPMDIHFTDDLPGAGLHVGSDALQLDQTILRTAADVLA